MLKQLKTISTICMLALTMAAAPAAFAAALGSLGEDTWRNFWTEPMMKAMDKNKDGTVSRTEFMEYMGKQFDMMDQNKDKMLNAKEFMDKKMMQSTFPVQFPD